MKRDNKKALYESIMVAVAKEVKKALNESSRDSVGTVLNYNTIYDAINDVMIKNGLQDYFEDDGNVTDTLFIRYPEYGNAIAKKVAKELHTSIANVKWNIKDYYSSDLAQDFCGSSEDEDNEEYESITYNDIINVVEGEDYQEIIDDGGEHIGERVLDEFDCPENGQYVYDACVEIAERLLDGEDPDDLRAEIGDNEI